MKNDVHESSKKVLKSRYIPTTQFYGQLIDSLQDYSIFTVDNELAIGRGLPFTLLANKPLKNKEDVEDSELSAKS